MSGLERGLRGWLTDHLKLEKGDCCLDPDHACQEVRLMLDDVVISSIVLELGE